MRSFRILWLACGLILCAACVQAQVVNIEGRRFMNDTVAWTGFVDLRFSVAENTQRSSSFGFSGALQHKVGKHTWFLINDMAFSRVESNAFQNTGYQHLRYNYALKNRWTAEGFVQSQYNKPLKLDLRLTAGAGPRFRAMDKEKVKVHLGTLVMYEYEKPTSEEEFALARSSSYLAATATFFTVVDLTTVIYYQPKLFDASDHRISLEASVLFRLTERFTFESRFNLLRDTGQPIGVPSLSYTWNNRFGFRF